MIVTGLNFSNLLISWYCWWLYLTLFCFFLFCFISFDLYGLREVPQEVQLVWRAPEAVKSSQVVSGSWGARSYWACWSAVICYIDVIAWYRCGLGALVGWVYGTDYMLKHPLTCNCLRISSFAYHGSGASNQFSIQWHLLLEKTKRDKVLDDDWLLCLFNSFLQFSLIPSSLSLDAFGLCTDFKCIHCCF